MKAKIHCHNFAAVLDRHHATDGKLTTISYTDKTGGVITAEVCESFAHLEEEFTPEIVDMIWRAAISDYMLTAMLTTIPTKITLERSPLPNYERIFRSMYGYGVGAAAGMALDGFIMVDYVEKPKND